MIRAAPVAWHALAARLVSQVLLRHVFPGQWDMEAVVNISKSGAATFSEADLRPLKLIEVNTQCVMSVVKERIREDVEARHLLDDAQHGFRTFWSTYSACMAILAAYEDAIRRGIPLHGIFLDIRKAYDTVERGGWQRPSSGKTGS